LARVASDQILVDFNCYVMQAASLGVSGVASGSVRLVIVNDEFILAYMQQHGGGRTADQIVTYTDMPGPCGPLEDSYK
jgi:hypothetical protein